MSYLVVTYLIVKLKECFFNFIFGHEWFCHALRWIFKNIPGSLCVDSVTAFHCLKKFSDADIFSDDSI